MKFLKNNPLRILADLTCFKSNAGHSYKGLTAPQGNLLYFRHLGGYLLIFPVWSSFELVFFQC